MEQKEMLLTILEVYGEDAYVQIPNEIFRELKNVEEMNNYSQYSFCYSYLVINSFLYKYNEFINISNSNFVSKSDIKIMLGYSAKSKSMDKFIKKNGLLEQSGIIYNDNKIPISTVKMAETHNYITITDKIYNTQIKDTHLLDMINKIKPKRFVISVPCFLNDREGFQYGTLHDYSFTHKIRLIDLLQFLYGIDMSKSNITNYFCAYNYFKYQQAYYGGGAKLSYSRICQDLCISEKYFFCLIRELEENKLLTYGNTGWTENANKTSVNKYQIIEI